MYKGDEGRNRDAHSKAPALLGKQHHRPLDAEALPMSRLQGTHKQVAARSKISLLRKGEITQNALSKPEKAEKERTTQKPTERSSGHERY